MKTKNLLWSAFFAFLLAGLFGCATMQAPKLQSGNDTLLVIPVSYANIMNARIEPFFFRFHIVNVDNKAVSKDVVITPRDGFEFVTGLPAGNYSISEIAMTSDPSGEGGSVSHGDFPVILEEGRATVIEGSFDIQLSRSDVNRTVNVDFDFHPITEETAKSLVKSLNGWSLSEASLKNRTLREAAVKQARRE